MSKDTRHFCKSYNITAADLAKKGFEQIPEQLVSGKHLIYSSPATLAFNSPGAEGFGVKRAALAIPGSVMLLVAPACCGRNTTIFSDIPGYENRFFYLLMDETDIVTGRHLKKIPEAVADICNSLKPRPSVVMICITCVDALLGTDMERVCRKASKKAGVYVLPSYMYALTREGRKPPMVHVRQSIYSLLEKKRRRRSSVNILGFFAPLIEDCELYDLMRQAGVKQIREIARCNDFSEYLDMAEANFNLVLNPEARFAASDIQKRLNIPYIELARLYRLDQIKKQYELFAAALGTKFDDEEYYNEAAGEIAAFKERYPGLTFSIGEGANANAFELAYALLSYGFSVAEVFADPQQGDFIYIEKIAALSPHTRIYSNLGPGMIYYGKNQLDEGTGDIDISIGKDAAYYHPDKVNLMWSDDIQPFGYRGVIRFFRECDKALSGKENTVGRAGVREHFSLLVQNANTIKHFRRFIAPFAPDQSGAASVFCELGGMVIILDAGGCAGNICGFDEPRWFDSKSAIFSAGLRDMDAILGRDEKLVEKVDKACQEIACRFVAIIGTPVPSVIGTDYRALSRMIKKKTGLDVVAVDSNGMEDYDAGVKKAFKALFETFSEIALEDATNRAKDQAVSLDQPTVVGILGATPLDITVADEKSAGGKSSGKAGPVKRIAPALHDYYRAKGYAEVYTYGMDSDIDDIKRAGKVDKNLVIAPAALATARYLNKKYGTPYQADYPLETLPAWEEILDHLPHMQGKSVLIIHQQMLANALRDYIKKECSSQNPPVKIRVASWFALDLEYKEEDDLQLRSEEDLVSLLNEGEYDYIIADSLFKAAAAKTSSTWIDVEHFAVSGRRYQS